MRTRLLTLAASVAAAVCGLAAGPAGAAPGPAAKVVQLGDSYSAGNGARGPDGSAHYDPAAPNCYRSPYNYGQQFANQIGATYTNAACSGATTTDLLTPGQNGLPAQADAVDQSADIVLLTMGGNDVGFTDIVVQCFVLRLGDPCRTALQNAIAAVPQMKQNLIAGLSGVRERMRPDAELMLLGYPNLSRSPSYTLLTSQGWYNAKADLDTLMALGAQTQQEVIDSLNATTGSTASYYISTVDEAYAGHEIDQRRLLPRSTDWLWNTAETWVIAETYHPKPAGWAATAGELAAEYAKHPVTPKPEGV